MNENATERLTDLRLPTANLRSLEALAAADTDPKLTSIALTARVVFAGLFGLFGAGLTAVAIRSGLHDGWDFAGILAGIGLAFTVGASLLGWWFWRMRAIYRAAL